MQLTEKEDPMAPLHKISNLADNPGTQHGFRSCFLVTLHIPRTPVTV